MFKKIWHYLSTFLSGMFMSISDIIPGFSGGIALTIVRKTKLVWQTWEKIIKPKEKGERFKAIMFYSIFILGSVSGTFGFSQLIYLMLEEIPSITFWLFLSLSIGSIFIFRRYNKIVISKRNKEPSGKLLFSFIIGALVIIGICTFTFVFRGSYTIAELRNETGEVNEASIYITMYVAGFLSSAAMVTPGISGAMIILMFGVYGNIYGGMYAHPWDHPIVLIIYISCVLCGTIISVVILDKMYRKHTKVLNWFFMGTISAGFIGMIWIFGPILIPKNPIRWIFIVIGVLVGIGITTFIIFYEKRQHFSKEENESTNPNHGNIPKKTMTKDEVNNAQREQ